LNREDIIKHCISQYLKCRQNKIICYRKLWWSLSI